MKRHYSASVLDPEGISHVSVITRAQRAGKSRNTNITVRSRIDRPSHSPLFLSFHVRGERVSSSSVALEVDSLSPTLHKVTVELAQSQKWIHTSFTVTRAYDIRQPLLQIKISGQEVEEQPSHRRASLLISGIAAAGMLVFGSLFIQSRTNDRTVTAAIVTTTTVTTIASAPELPHSNIANGHALPPYSKFPELTQNADAALLEDVPDDGQTWLVIPRLYLRIPVVKGTDNPDLDLGAGWYPSTDSPGTSGNVGLAGHRTTAPAPFFFLDKLEVNDSIYLVVKDKLFRYLVIAADNGVAYKIVQPADISVIKRLGFDAITLTTCTPIGSDAERLIVHAKLSNSQTFSRKQSQ